MEAPHQRIRRLTTALKDLSDHSFFLLEAGEFAEGLEGLERTRPLVEEIVRLMTVPGAPVALDADTLERVEAIMAAQRRQMESLETRKTAVREELYTLRHAQTRTHQLRAAYGGSSRPPLPVAMQA
jgi:hypothetical protein